MRVSAVVAMSAAAGRHGSSAAFCTTAEEERYCPEVLMQIAFVLEATRSAGRALLDSHLRHSATAAVRSGEPACAEAMYEELLDLVYRTARQRLDPGQAVSPGIGCDPVG